MRVLSDSLSSLMYNFTPYSGHLMGLPVTESHLVYRWNHPCCKVLFSVTRLGEAVSCHFSSCPKGVRHLKEAIDEWCQFVFQTLEWCTMVIAQVVKPSVARLIEKRGFKPVGKVDDIMVYARCR